MNRPEYHTGRSWTGTTLKEYLNALGSYMTTVMTSEKASRSSPYKKLFDSQYKTWTDSEG